MLEILTIFNTIAIIGLGLYIRSLVQELKKRPISTEAPTTVLEVIDECDKPSDTGVTAPVNAEKPLDLTREDIANISLKAHVSISGELSFCLHNNTEYEIAFLDVEVTKVNSKESPNVHRLESYPYLAGPYSEAAHEISTNNYHFDTLELRGEPITVKVLRGRRGKH